MTRFILLFFLCINIHASKAQDLSVSEEILNELETVILYSEVDTFTFRVAFPKNYDPKKEYKCFLGLSGGNQSLKIVNYCYAAWFRSGYFVDYITVLPVVTDTLNFRDYSNEKIEGLLKIINKNYRVNPKWLIAGTSNGGVAAFNFVAAFPEKFEGIIVAPGKISDAIQPTEKWSHLKVILACGDKDDPKWIKATKKSAKKIKKIVRSVKLVPLKGQGHILPIKFNADKMYDPYFL